MAEPVQNKAFGLTLPFAIQMVTIVVGLTVGWTTMDQKIQRFDEILLTTGVEIKQLKEETRKLETSQIRLDERFTNIMAMLQRIVDQLDKAGSIK